MAEGRGGYQPPSNPAPVSGPGALSQRTDVQAPMTMPDAQYGEAAEFDALQGGAPMMSEPGLPFGSLFDSTQRPNEPVTAGAPSGEGPGMEALGIREQSLAEMKEINRYLPVMERMAGRVDAPRSFRALVDFVKNYNGATGQQ
jgi:hypothetical protein